MENLIEMKRKDGMIDMEAFQFCIKALMLKKNSYDKRVYVDHVLIEDGFAYGTDSRRFHRAKLNGEYKNGLYRVFKNLKSHIGLFHEFDRTEDNYPNFSSILPMGPLRIIANNYYGPDLSYINGMCKIIRLLPGNEGINPKYLECLDDIFDLKMKSNVTFLENDSRLAIIMALHAA